MIPNFISQALSNRPLTVYGDGSQTRSIQYVEDLIEGTLRLMRSSERLPVNIGNPHEMSVRQVAEMIIELLGSESGMVFEPLPEDDPRRRCPDITRAREVLGWEPRVPARAGLQKTLSWFAGRSGASSAKR
jgi:dTDP-glucose 4,6-dehydratase